MTYPHAPVRPDLYVETLKSVSCLGGTGKSNSAARLAIWGQQSLLLVCAGPWVGQPRSSQRLHEFDLWLTRPGG